MIELSQLSISKENKQWGVKKWSMLSAVVYNMKKKYVSHAELMDIYLSVLFHWPLQNLPPTQESFDLKQTNKQQQLRKTFLRISSLIPFF